MAVRAVFRGLVAGCATAACLVALAAGIGSAQSFPTTDAPAGYIVFPKVVAATQQTCIGGVAPGASCIDSTQCPGTVGPPAVLPGVCSAALDTVIQITNTNPSFGRTLHCFYVDPSDDCRVDDFDIPLTRGQPFAWRVSEGSSNPLIPGRDCTPTAQGCVPFLGELKCFESNGDQTNPVPVNVNEIVGEATIYTVSSGVPGSVDIRSYNGVGFQTTPVSAAEPPSAQPRRCTSGTNAGGVCTSDTQCPLSQCGVLMCLGSTAGSGAQCATPPAGVNTYAGCPSTLILNNFFDDATDPATGKPITTRLTLVPCSEDLSITETGGIDEPVTAVQFLLFNEFEQRMSTSTRLHCFSDSQLSNIDAKVGAEKASVFNVGTQGTLAGQTRIRGVTTSETSVGHGLIGISEEFHGTASVAVNLNQAGLNAGKGDFVRTP